MELIATDFFDVHTALANKVPDKFNMASRGRERERGGAIGIDWFDVRADGTCNVSDPSGRAPRAAMARRADNPRSAAVRKTWFPLRSVDAVCALPIARQPETEQKY